MKNSPPVPAVCLREVTKSFGNGTVVSDVSLTVERGVCLGLLGPNGAGKSTTLKMIYGFLRPSSGKVLVNGTDVTRDPGTVRKGLGIAPQEDTLDPDLSVTQNLLFHARYSRIPRSEALRRATELSRTMGIEQYADAPVAHLSTGQRRRLVLARALLNDPAIVVLDEPSRGLDRESRQLCLDVLKRMKREGVTLILATHELAEAEALCDLVALMDRGRVTSTGPVWEVLARKGGK